MVHNQTKSQDAFCYQEHIISLNVLQLMKEIKAFMILNELVFCSVEIFLLIIIDPLLDPLVKTGGDSRFFETL